MQVIDESHVIAFADMLRILPDVDIQRPLWEFTPAERPAVIHERRRRFGVYEEIGDPDYS